MSDHGKLHLRINCARHLDRRRATIHKDNCPVVNELCGFFRYSLFFVLTAELPLEDRFKEGDARQPAAMDSLDQTLRPPVDSNPGEPYRSRLSDAPSTLRLPLCPPVAEHPESFAGVREGKIFLKIWDRIRIHWLHDYAVLCMECQ